MRRLRRPTTILLVLVVLGAWTWIEREPLLGGAAELWVISDSVGLADAVVILGGGLGNRSFVAAEFYKKGLVNRVLISQVAEDQAIANRDEPGQTESNRYALLNLGVPVNTIETFGKANKNTRDEALALREWAERHPVSDFIIPTENFITRRTRWIFRRVLARAGVPRLRAAELERTAEEERGV